MLPAAYTQQPGEPPPRYDLPTAERALRCIAARMNKDGTRDLQWWRVPAWAQAAPRVIVTWLVAGLVAGLAAALVFGLAAGLVAGLAVGSGNNIPRQIGPVRWRQLFRRRPLVLGLLVGVATRSLTATVETGAGFPAHLWAGLAAAFVAWLVVGLIAGMARPETDNTSPLSPLPSRRSDQAFGLVVGLMVWLGVALVSGIAFGIGTGHLARGFAYGLAYGLVAGLVVGLVYPQSWSSSLTFAQLAASDRTPVRLMQFLEDARTRSVLRTVGPAYQFRHARLQDRLAVQEPATGHSPGEPRLPTGDAAAPAVEAPPASAR